VTWWISSDPRVTGEIGPARGDVSGQHRVHEFLGEGGMGTVFEVEHIALGRRHALKVLRTNVIERDHVGVVRHRHRLDVDRVGLRAHRGGEGHIGDPTWIGAPRRLDMRARAGHRHHDRSRILPAR
jgi:serine/threonine protein kinase